MLRTEQARLSCRLGWSLWDGRFCSQMHYHMVPSNSIWVEFYGSAAVALNL